MQPISSRAGLLSWDPVSGGVMHAMPISVLGPVEVPILTRNMTPYKILYSKTNYSYMTVFPFLAPIHQQKGTRLAGAVWPMYWNSTRIFAVVGID